MGRRPISDLELSLLLLVVMIMPRFVVSIVIVVAGLCVPQPPWRLLEHLLLHVMLCFSVQCFI